MDQQITDSAKKEKDSKKKMNAANAKGLNGMKQKVKKSLREFESAVESYKQVSFVSADSEHSTDIKQLAVLLQHRTLTLSRLLTMLPLLELLPLTTETARHEPRRLGRPLARMKRVMIS
jgi:hypothetical protein